MAAVGAGALVKYEPYPRSIALYEPYPRSIALYEPYPRSIALYEPYPRSIALYEPYPRSIALYEPYPRSIALYEPYPRSIALYALNCFVGHCRAQVSHLQEKIASGEREEESWKAELAEITGNHTVFTATVCIVLEHCLQSSPVMPRKNMKPTSRREQNFFRGKVYAPPPLPPLILHYYWAPSPSHTGWPL